MQERSRKTIERVLTTAAELLDEVGWEGFNTNRLAERAGCRVATIYRYFPDKIALITVLAECVTAVWHSQLITIEQELENQRELREIWGEYLQKFVITVRQTPGALAIRKAMRVVPELQVIDDEDSARLTIFLTGILTRCFPNLSKKRARAAARTLIESGAALVDHAHRASPTEANELVRELSVMHEAYLSTLEKPR
ncbi:MAG: TetR/AcrR family transcriptional regulator [Myxococcota bacterium]